MAWLTGMAKPTPMLPVCSSLLPRVRMAELMPITRAWASTSGPPELPGLIAASVWIAVDEGERASRRCRRPATTTGRSTAETMPWLTDSDEAERGAEREHRLADPERVGVPGDQRAEVARRLDLDHGQVVRRAAADQGRPSDAGRRRSHPDRRAVGRAGDDVVVGQDAALVVQHEAGAGAPVPTWMVTVPGRARAATADAVHRSGRQRARGWRPAVGRRRVGGRGDRGRRGAAVATSSRPASSAPP